MLAGGVRLGESCCGRREEEKMNEQPDEGPAAPLGELTRALRKKAAEGRDGGATARVLASGEGWRALDIVCTCGPRDSAFEERHAETAISLVLTGSFVYRGAYRRSLLTAGALLLSEAGRCYECGHEHGEGDRCLSFHYAPDLFERAAAEAGAARAIFGRSALAPAARLSPLAARAALALIENEGFEDIAFDFAVETMRACADGAPPKPANIDDERRAAEAARLIEERLDAPLGVAELAAVVGLSPFRFLHVFKTVIGVSPHQYRLRRRLRAAALKLRTTQDSVTEIGLASGFEDLSNFVRSFRREFGLSPGRYREAR